MGAPISGVNGMPDPDPLEEALGETDVRSAEVVWVGDDPLPTVIAQSASAFETLGLFAFGFFRTLFDLLDEDDDE